MGIALFSTKAHKTDGERFYPGRGKVGRSVVGGNGNDICPRMGLTGPIGINTELKYALDRAKTGASLAQALQDIADRTGLLDARRLATSVTQAQRHGVPVADTLMDAVGMLVNDVKTRPPGKPRSLNRKCN